MVKAQQTKFKQLIAKPNTTNKQYHCRWARTMAAILNFNTASVNVQKFEKRAKNSICTVQSIWHRNLAIHKAHSSRGLLYLNLALYYQNNQQFSFTTNMHFTQVNISSQIKPKHFNIQKQHVLHIYLFFKEKASTITDNRWYVKVRISSDCDTDEV
jgi:hypothetical protein